MDLMGNRERNEMLEVPGGGQETDTIQLTTPNRMVTAVAMAIALAMGGCTKRSAESAQPPAASNMVNVEVMDHGLRIDQRITGTEKQEVIAAFEEYRKAYGFDGHVNVIDARLTSIEANGRIRPEYTEGRNMKIDTQAIRRLSTNILPWTVRHALTHAQRPEQKTAIKPFDYNDGASQLKVNAFHGLTVVAQTANGETVSFKQIEEGACEVLAYTLNDNYKTNSPAYSAYYRLTLAIMQKGGVEPKHLAQLVRKNDVWGFVQLVTGSRKANNEDLKKVMSWYSNPSSLTGSIAEIQKY